MVERIQDLNLPNSNITKIIRDSLPADVNMDKGKFVFGVSTISALYFGIFVFDQIWFSFQFLVFLSFRVITQS